MKAVGGVSKRGQNAGSKIAVTSRLRKRFAIGVARTQGANKGGLRCEGLALE